MDAQPFARDGAASHRQTDGTAGVRSDRGKGLGQVPQLELYTSTAFPRDGRVVISHEDTGDRFGIDAPRRQSQYAWLRRHYAADDRGAKRQRSDGAAGLDPRRNPT